MRARRAPAIAALVLAAVGGLAFPDDARADPPSVEMRARVEDAFVDGRLDVLEQLSEPGKEPVSVEPLAVRDLLWRPVVGSPTWRLPERSVEPTSVSARRLVWLAAYASARTRGAPLPVEPYPAPAAGEDDPYPRLTAWVRDRLLRETEGTTSMGVDGPIGDLVEDELSTYWVKAFRRPGIAGPGAEPPDEETLAKRRAVREGVVTARALGIAAVGFWALVGGLLLVFRGSRVKAPSPPTEA